MWWEVKSPEDGHRFPSLRRDDGGAGFSAANLVKSCFSRLKNIVLITILSDNLGKIRLRRKPESDPTENPVTKEERGPGRT